MWKPTQISSNAPIMPIMRVSISVARISRLNNGSSGTSLRPIGADELMLPP